MSRWKITGVSNMIVDRRSSYAFATEEAYEEAKSHLYKKMYQDYKDPDKLYFEGWCGGEYIISIMDNCSNPLDAASICKEHEGHYKG